MGELDPATVNAVKWWLDNGNNSREKEMALFEYWETLGYTETRRTYEALMEMRGKLGMTEYLPQSRYKSGNDAAMNWYMDMGDPSVNPGAEYYGRRSGNTGKRHKNTTGVHPLHRIALRAAAVVIPVLIVAGAFLWYNAERRGGRTEVLMTFITAEGEARRVFLPDGTEVMLNGGSRLEYVGDRQAALSGEGYFKVVSDASDPFVLKTPKMTVKVIGTEFNMEAYPAKMRTDLDLYKGTVEASVGSKLYLMKPGTRIGYDHLTGAVTTGNTLQPNKPAWVSDRLSLRESTLPEIFAMLQWYYNIAIEIPADIDASSLYVFELGGEEDIEKALDMLQSVSGSFSHETAEGKIIIKAVK